MTILDKVFCRPCIFCEIIDGNAPSRLIYKDDTIAAFHDIRPAAETHILIIPVTHIENVKFLKYEHTSLLEKMYQKGIELLQENGHKPEESKLGFHVPPFNTVDHLHLHVLGGKFKSNIKKLKYESGRRWYMDLVQLKENLEKQQKAQQSARL